jgi:hypothetical protein
MLNPDYEPSLLHRFDTVSLPASLEIVDSGKSHSPRPDGHRLALEAEDFPGLAVERGVSDFVFAVRD